MGIKSIEATQNPKKTTHEENAVTEAPLQHADVALAKAFEAGFKAKVKAAEDSRLCLGARACAPSSFPSGTDT